MGTKQTKGAGSEAGPSPQHSGWKRTPTKQRGDLFASFMLRSGDRFGRGGPPPPYQRRIGMIQEMMVMAKEGKQSEATELLKTLRQDLGMESTSLDDVLYRYASFRSLVDPITHDLIISLARYVHCPKTEGDALTAMEKVCRQLTYHLSPHSRWRRQGLLKRKPQACLKAVLSSPPSGGTVDLSGIPLTVRDMERLCSHLQRHAQRVCSLELGFTELTDESFLLLLPTLGALPRLETLALNGNRLTRAVLKELTDVLKDPSSFPAVTWIDLGNNVDIFSLPQPFLVSLRKRCPKQGNLPTILEFGESQASEPDGRGAGGGDEGDEGARTESIEDLRSDTEGEVEGEAEAEGMAEEMAESDKEAQGNGEEAMEEGSKLAVREPAWVGGKETAVTQEQREREGGESVKEQEDTQICPSHLPGSRQSQELSVSRPVGGEVEDWATTKITDNQT
ncbi:leucine-rich repeat-containing protein 75A-like [Megalops cyprinoides]|uniref:leucine-rich repeat-containing protein 75A-like n=1 Tax=Megalops cyprinoides TaxID=118141 RepID=UPI00186484E4|nr:leucine-rich repeat-containing protein 75A-like [Megalops cyprinoides]